MCTSMGWVFYISTFDSHNKGKIDPKKTCRGREKGESHQNPRTRWRGLTPKTWSIKGNINKWNLTKIKNFYSAKDPTNKMKGQIIDTLAPENVHAKTCTLMFTVALLVITKKLETNQLAFILWYIHTMKYYSTIKRDELLIYAKTLMGSKEIMLSEKG